MLIRRILAGLCALCLAVPAMATAKDVRFVGHAHHAVAVVAIGDTKDDLPAATPAVATGDTKDDLPAATPAVATGDTKDDLSAATPAVATGDTKSDLPGSVAAASHDTAIAPRRTSQPAASTDDATNGWQIAAIAEAALLAALAIGAFAFVANRQHRAPRMGV